MGVQTLHVCVCMSKPFQIMDGQEVKRQLIDSRQLPTLAICQIIRPKINDWLKETRVATTLTDRTALQICQSHIGLPPIPHRSAPHFYPWHTVSMPKCPWAMDIWSSSLRDPSGCRFDTLCFIRKGLESWFAAINSATVGQDVSSSQGIETVKSSPLSIPLFFFLPFFLSDR